MADTPTCSDRVQRPKIRCTDAGQTIQNLAFWSCVRMKQLLIVLVTLFFTCYVAARAASEKNDLEEIRRKF